MRTGGVSGSLTGWPPSAIADHCPGKTIPSRGMQERRSYRLSSHDSPLAAVDGRRRLHLLAGALRDGWSSCSVMKPHLSLLRICLDNNKSVAGDLPSR